MKLRQTAWAAVICLSLSLVSLTTWAAYTPPDVSKRIPREVVYAFLVSNPGQALGHLDAILQKFKSISPEMDLKTHGERIKNDVGENLLTAEGLKAFGLDPAGTYAVYGTGIERGPVVALALSSPAVFKEKIIALIKKDKPDFKTKPKMKAGVEIYQIDKGYFGFKGSLCVVLSPESINPGQKDKQLLAFFKPGKKLAADPAFKRTLDNMPDELHALLYLDLRRLVSLGFKQSQDSTKNLIKSYQNRKDKGNNAAFIKSMKKEVAMLGKLRKWSKKELAFIDRVALGWTIRARSIDSAGFLGATAKGIKTLRAILPPQSEAPGFHNGLMETSVLGAWMSLDLLKLLDKVGPLPTYGDMTVKKSLEQDVAGFKQDTKVDFLKEVLGGMAGPGAFYLLQPGQAPADAKLSAGQQLTQMIRVAFLAQVKNPKQAGLVIDRLNQVIKTRGMPLDIKDLSGASVTTLQPEPGSVLSWGLKDDTVFITFGENTAKALVKILSQKAWAKKSASGPLGAGLLDFAVLTEGISSAMSRGVGGQDAAQFRMMIWPIVQQVLGKMSKIHFSARMVDRGLSTAGSLEFR